jgi:hypothetical protein
VTCADTIRAATGERWRTGVNETKTETRRGLLVPWRPEPVDGFDRCGAQSSQAVAATCAACDPKSRRLCVCLLMVRHQRPSGAEQPVLSLPLLRCNCFAFEFYPVVLTVIARTRIDAGNWSPSGGLCAPASTAVSPASSGSVRRR